MSEKILKVTYASDVRRLKIDLPASMKQSQAVAAIYEAVARGFSIPAPSFSLTYKDDELDMCTLHAAAFHDFLENAREGKIDNVLRLFVSKVEDCVANNDAKQQCELIPAPKVQGDLFVDMDPDGSQRGHCRGKPSQVEDAIRSLKNLVNKCTIDALDGSTLEQRLLHSLPDLARVASWKQWKVDIRGIERRDELLTPLASLLIHVESSAEMAQPKAELSAYLDGSEPNRLGAAFAALLQAWNQEADQAVQATLQNAAKDLMVVLQLLFPHMFGQKLICSAKQAFMQLKETLMCQKGERQDADVISDLLLSALPFLMQLAYRKHDIVDWRGIERRSELLAPLANLLEHVNSGHSDSDAAGCPKAILIAYLNGTRGDTLGRFFYFLLQQWTEVEPCELIRETMRACALDLAEIFPLIFPGMFSQDGKRKHMKRFWRKTFEAKGKGKASKDICAGEGAWKGKGKMKGRGISSVGKDVEGQHTDNRQFESGFDFGSDFKAMRCCKGALRCTGLCISECFEEDNAARDLHYHLAGKGGVKGKGRAKGNGKSWGKGKGWGKGWWWRPCRRGQQLLMDHSESQSDEHGAGATPEPTYFPVVHTEHDAPQLSLA